jgi:anti-sigma28 factor (negative regulator of flagellin synthesis)
MTDINPVSTPVVSNLGAAGRGAGTATKSEPSDTAPTRGSDKAEFSAAAQYLSKLQQMPAVRQDVVDRVRSEIAKGTYDTPDKIDALMNSLGQDLQG